MSDNEEENLTKEQREEKERIERAKEDAEQAGKLCTPSIEHYPAYEP